MIILSIIKAYANLAQRLKGIQVSDEWITRPVGIQSPLVNLYVIVYLLSINEIGLYWIYFLSIVFLIQIYKRLSG